jgi:acyl transferase domain-containing protein/thioesterase domain-containing protein
MDASLDSIEQIAIVGMAGRFPGAQNITQFWQNLAAGVESISRFSDEELLARGVSEEKIRHPHYVKAGTILQDADMFDASFFGYNRREAETMDPQQRIFLEIAWEALESAGYNPDSYDGPIAVFAGTSGNDYRKRIAANQLSITSGLDSFELMVGNDADFLTTRVSYKLNLKGPSLTIQTACSTSLVAVHQACQSLLTYQCDMALAGGVCIRFPQGLGYMHQEGMIWSPDGHCRPFDAQARGTLFGHGAGIVVLKRLSEALQDNDTILAVIKGSAINNDGAMKVGFTAPSVDGQAEVIASALAFGDVTAETVSYIEAHGTGTPLGDPIEIEALTQAFRSHTDRTGYCAIGSVKSNIGHLDAAAGVAGLIKTVLALQHKKIPPSLHFTSPNPNIDFAGSPFYVNNTLQEWQSDGQPRRAGVSSFGIGGTNAHVVLEEAPVAQTVASSKSWHLLPLSAKSETALQSLTANLAKHLINHPNLSLADAAYTLQLGRKSFSYRGMAVCSGLQDAIDTLSSQETAPGFTTISGSSKRDIIFMFSGQGSQHVNMCRDLYQEYPFFKEQIDLCSEILQPHLGLDLRHILYPPEDKIQEATEQITQTFITQPALFTIEYSLARLWNHFGISPSALVGHSIGEYTAACIAGVFSLEDALRLVAARGRLMQSLPPGSMLAIPLSEKDVQPYLSPEISLAVLNSASMSVVSGETDKIDNLANLLSEKGIEGRILRTSHAFHSPMMDPILEDFAKEVEKTSRRAPQIPFVSNVTGAWITETQAIDPSYWAKHLRQTVHFFSCAGELLNSYPKGILLEVGPGQTLSLLAKQHTASTVEHNFLASTRRTVERKNDVQYFLGTLGKLWAGGCQIDWPKLYEGENRRRIPLPAYPFERKRYWIWQDEVLEKNSHVALRPAPLAGKNQTVIPSAPELASQISSIDYAHRPESKKNEHPQTKTEKLLARIWLPLLPGIDRIGRSDDFFELGGESLQAVQMFAELEKTTGINLPLSTLFEAPQLKKLALIIDSKSRHSSLENDPWRSLVAIQPNGSKPPFFCVHGAGSNVLNYQVFVPFLGDDQPFYGLQPQGLDGITPPLTDIKSMAAHYISEIRTIQPHGPYYLGGGSFGGTVALEMAQQLQRSGETVAFLAMFDTQRPNSPPTQPSKSIKNYMQKLAGLTLQKKILRILKTSAFIASAIAQNTQISVCKMAKRPIPHDLRYSYLQRINLKTWYSCRPETYSGCITLFRAYNDAEKNNYDPKHGWDGLAAEIEVIEIPGDHETFIEVPEVGEKFKEMLLQAQKNYGG